MNGSDLATLRAPRGVSEEAFDQIAAPSCAGQLAHELFERLVGELLCPGALTHSLAYGAMWYIGTTAGISGHSDEEFVEALDSGAWLEIAVPKEILCSFSRLAEDIYCDAWQMGDLEQICDAVRLEAGLRALGNLAKARRSMAA